MGLIKKIASFNCAFFSTAAILPVLFFVVFAGAASGQERVHAVFFEGTDYELNVYRIYGKEPGKTILLIGGIQGDEPGGFLSADHYADISLEKGNLIVVPRANFQSIVMNKRQINEDMNREFSEGQSAGYESKIVEILKKLISESDCLLNLHDGSGFYSETWVSPERNPKKYGQSIIADCQLYKKSDGDVLNLKEMAEHVIAKINPSIKKKEYFFHFSNHRTKENSSIHKEQRKSATYYALYTCEIPAFGIETSKSLPLELKVRHHNFAINAFMDLFGVIPETPGFNLKKPELKYVVLSVNDSLPIALKNNETLSVAKGDYVTISHIEANYERGLTADILGTGTINDLRKKIKIERPARVAIRKDYYPCGSVYLSIGADSGSAGHGISISQGNGLAGKTLLYKINVNGNERIIENYGRATLVRGDILELVDVITGVDNPSELVVNFKGYVGDTSGNTGEDRGYEIDTGRDLWKRYSVDKKGRSYKIVTTLNGEDVGKMYIDLVTPSFDYIVFETSDGKGLCCKSGGTFYAAPDEPLSVSDIVSKGFSDEVKVEAYLTVPGGKGKKRIFPGGEIELKSYMHDDTVKNKAPAVIEVRRGGIVAGEVYIKNIQEKK